jgi:hypothetical protein
VARKDGLQPDAAPVETIQELRAAGTLYNKRVQKKA